MNDTKAPRRTEIQVTREARTADGPFRRVACCCGENFVSTAEWADHMLTARDHEDCA